MLTIGIDLGTTASVVAVAKDGHAKVIKLDNANATVPSVVNYSEKVPIVGRAAFLKDSSATVLAVKRHMGTDTKFFGRTPAEVSADILSFLKKMTERRLGEKVDAAVITVPAHFSELQRMATKQAASLAGIKVIRLVNEPTAAAIAFGINQNGIFAVYDLGGGTFDFSILRVIDGVFQVLATGGDNYLGGNDIDEIIAEHNLQRYHIENITETKKNSALLVAKFLKEHIRDKKSVEANFSYRGKSYLFSLDQNLLQKATNIILQKTSKIVKQVLADANVARLNGVVLVGGMTKLSLVRDFVQKCFGNTRVYDNINPDEAVALGAALEAESATNKNSNILLIDVVPLTLGIETFGGGVDKIIHRNTPIPISENRQYTTYQNNQTGMKFHVLQGESSLASECRSLANFELRGIPPMPAGVAHINVKFSVDVNGLLTVSAVEQSTKIEQTAVVEPSAGLTDSEMISMLEKAFSNQKIDNEKARNIELIVDTNRAIIFWKSIIGELPESECKNVKNLVEQLENLVEQKQYKEIVQLSEKIEKIVGQFIDDIINNHLCGRHVINI